MQTLTFITATAMAVTLAAGGAGHRCAEPPLTGTRWLAQALIDTTGLTPVRTPRPAYLTIQDGGAVEGYDGCNAVDATATPVDADTLSFTGFGTQKRMCGDSDFRLELRVPEVLNGEIDWSISHRELRLVRPDGRGLLLRAEQVSPA